MSVLVCRNSHYYNTTTVFLLCYYCGLFVALTIQLSCDPITATWNNEHDAHFIAESYNNNNSSLAVRDVMTRYEACLSRGEVSHCLNNLSIVVLVWFTTTENRVISIPCLRCLCPVLYKHDTTNRSGESIMYTATINYNNNRQYYTLW